MQFIDTNIFLRYLTADVSSKAKACYTLFKRAEHNEISLTTSEAVVAEVVFILSSKRHYGLKPADVKKLLYPLLALRGLKLQHRKTYLRALEYYAKYHIDYENCLTVAHMQRQRLSTLYSYDRDFDPIQGINRVEPQEQKE